MEERNVTAYGERVIENDPELDEQGRREIAKKGMVMSKRVSEDIDTKIARFAALVERNQRDRLARLYPNIDLSGAGRALPGAYRVKVTKASKYTRVDFDNSGKYMVVNATGEIYGIKGYGVIHRGHFYGTLDEIEQWDWSGYTGVKR